MRSPTPERSSTSAGCPILSSKARVRSEAPPEEVPADPAGAGGPADAADLRRLYTAELAAHHFASDDAQLAVVTRLEDLRQRVQAAGPHPGIQIPRWLATLLRHDAVAPVRGLYLWGSVGRGKTWLVDLFCASLPRTLVRAGRCLRASARGNRRAACARSGTTSRMHAERAADPRRGGVATDVR